MSAMDVQQIDDPVAAASADAARRQRLDAVMGTRAARWCAETVASCQARNVEAGRPTEAPANIADTYADVIAGDLVRAVWARGTDPAEAHRVNDAWKYRALTAWGRLEYLTDDFGRRRPVPPHYDSGMAELEAADAATDWQLPSERTAL